MPNSDDAVDLTADYQRAGFQRRLGFGTSPALVVIDMARAYLDTSLAATLKALRVDTLIITGGFQQADAYALSVSMPARTVSFQSSFAKL